MGDADSEALYDWRRRVRELQDSNDFHGVLLAMAGHDLRQPLQVITGTYDRLERRVGNCSEESYLRRGKVAIAQLTYQLDLVIDALRMHEHSASIQRAPIMVDPLLVRICRESEEVAEHGGVTLRAKPTHAAAVSNAILLEVILRNLIRNAVKFSRPGGRIVVGCRRRGNGLRIEVHDNGIGIAADKLAVIFDAFHRLDLSRVDGLGLGLFVVRRAARLLGHVVEVRSEIGRGSCFSVLTDAANAGYSTE